MLVFFIYGLQCFEVCSFCAHFLESFYHKGKWKVKSLSCVRLFATPLDCSLCPWDFLGNSTGVDCHFLLQGLFPTQGLNLGFPHCRQMLYHLSHQGSPIKLLGGCLIGKQGKKRPTCLIVIWRPVPLKELFSNLWRAFFLKWVVACKELTSFHWWFQGKKRIPSFWNHLNNFL